MKSIAPVAGEILVAPVARQGDRDVRPGELADAVGGDRRAVGVRLVVEPRQLVDQIEVVALDPVDMVARAVALGHLKGESRLVEGRVGESDRAGLDRLR